MKIEVRDHASLRIEMNEGETLELVDAAGRPFGLAGRRVITLCRCGRSQSKPFCDSSHKQGFESVCAARDLPPPVPKP